MKKYDLCVIGAGPAGYAAAMRAVDFGKSVVLIEKDKVGGAGLYDGALSSKTMWELSQKVYDVNETIVSVGRRKFEISWEEVQKTINEALFDRKFQYSCHIKLLEAETQNSIFKYERGGVNPTSGLVSLVSPDADSSVKDTVKWNKVTGAWVLTNAFPFNISNVQLNNGPAATMSMEVSFYYERYRFYQPSNSGVESIPDYLGPNGPLAQQGIQASNSVGLQNVNGTATTATTTVSGTGNGKIR